MRISDWSSDVCSSDLVAQRHRAADQAHVPEQARDHRLAVLARGEKLHHPAAAEHQRAGQPDQLPRRHVHAGPLEPRDGGVHEVGGGDHLWAPGAWRRGKEEKGTPRKKRERSEEHTSELQSIMRITYAVFCLKKKIKRKKHK